MSRRGGKSSPVLRGRELLLLVPAANVAFLIIWLARTEVLGVLPMIATSALSGLALVAYVALGRLRPLPDEARKARRPF